MKKIYTLIIASFFTVAAVNAATHNVTANSNNTFTPSTFAAVVGDVVVWTNAGGTHNVKSIPTSVPAGAAAINSPDPLTTYSYTITVAGNYGYQCTYHPGMVGGFTVTAVGITEPVVNLLTSAYPNPFNDKITVKYNGIQSIEIFNVIGDKVRMVELSPSDNKTEIDFSNFPAGVYFYRTYKEGTIVETRKIVKAY